MSDSVRSHRQQPTRFHRPWDSPGKNTGVGCHFLLQCMKVKSESEVAQSCPTLSNTMDCSLPGSSIHGIFQARVLEWGAIAFSKDVFKSSYNDLKFMVQNFNYVCTKLISSVIYNCHNLLSFALLVPTLSNSIPSLPSDWSSSSTSLLEILLLLPSA